MLKLKKLFVIIFFLGGFIHVIKSQVTNIMYTIDDVSLFSNPERGWAHSYNPSGNNPGPDLNKNTLINDREGPDHITLIRKYYMLKAYLEGPIEDSFLEGFQNDLNACRKAGVKLVPRFIYVWNPASSNHDAPLSIVIEHVEQIKPFLKSNCDVIAFMEAGFVGDYGEWHGSDWNYIDNYTLEVKPDGVIVRDSLLSALPQQRFLVMRYMYWHKFKFWPEPLLQEQAFNKTKQARIGYHNDHIMGTNRWDAPGCAECPSYNTMHDYLIQDTKWVPSTGEPGGDSYYDTHDPQPELRALHFSTLINNAGIDYSVWKSKNFYKGLTRDLGYRISIKEATFSEIVPGFELDLHLKLINSGYAAPFNERKFEIILRNRTTGFKYVWDARDDRDKTTDPRYWQPGDIIIDLSIPVPDDLPTGDYDIIMNLPDPSESLHDRPECSIRLANHNIWEAETGFNVLYDINTSIQEVSSFPSTVKLFPNPAGREVTLKISLPEYSIVKISVFDNFGNRILQIPEEFFIAGKHKLKINTSEFVPSVYIVEVLINGLPKVEKLIKY